MSVTKRAVGRRPGNPETRESLVDAARVLFAEQGYDATSVRAVAGAAGVDAAMVNHYFGGKEGLFREVMALPVDPTAIASELLEGLTAENLPGRVSGLVVTVWEGPQTRPAMVTMLRRALSDPSQTSLLREFMTGGVLAPVAAHLAQAHPEDAAVRTALVASQMIGLMTARHIVRIPALTELNTTQLAALIESMIGQTLDGALPDALRPNPDDRRRPFAAPETPDTEGPHA